MSAELNNLSALREVPQTEQTEQVEAKNISYRANPNNTLERTPDGDYYDKQRKKKTIGIVAGLILTVAAVVGGICWHKGKPADGGEKKFFDRLKDGWKELTGKGKKAAEDGADKAGDAANGAKTEAESAAEKTGEAAANVLKKVEVTDETMKEYLVNIPESNREDVVAIIDAIKESGGKAHFAKNEEGVNILVVNPAKRNIKLATSYNEKFKEIELSNEVLEELNSKNLNELTAKRLNELPNEEKLNLNSYEDFGNSLLETQEKILNSPINDEIKKCLSDDKELSKKLLEKFIGKEELEKLSEDDASKAIADMLENFVTI